MIQYNVHCTNKYVDLMVANDKNHICIQISERERCKAAMTLVLRSQKVLQHKNQSTNCRKSQNA